ncbi:MAG: 2-amino-4-hydroxy-6-hydroxymethyldihydropteridine diphosphokinase [Gammaproteobacteria bacterium SHHR-1]|uniref:2-amino-4-hydroxy-6- hydroxymethyldihydropteridine diphosphokinase n=1 Tax=Magnetovirga frankeli TaxID=947516 RepID=UPI001293AB82|nr:2-amino-4-hydroxy-6-hydroxymethyldihydropteridine diphosphokinase [gamma proteobacterium SS-5]
MSKTCYIGLGSNLENPVEQLQTALQALAALPGVRLRQTSSFYRNPPMGPQDQPDYINAVVELELDMPAEALLEQLQRIENEHGRERNGERWGPRTLDLDILLYGEEFIDSTRLTVPHPGLAKRAFVLLPLYEIAPELVVPGLGSVAKLLEACDTYELEAIDLDPGNDH